MAIPPALFRNPEHYKGLSSEELDRVLAPQKPAESRPLFDEYDAVLWLAVASLWF